MFDSISKNISGKDVSKENINNLKESPKENIDDALFTNFNLSNTFDDFSINEMNLSFINLSSIDNNFYGLEEKKDDNNIFNQTIQDPSPLKNDIPQPMENNINDIPTVIPKKKKNPKNNKNEIQKLIKAIIDSSLKFVNDKISKTYNYNIGNGINKKRLFKINSKYIKNFRAEFNKQLLETTLGDIFSDNISGRITSYLFNFNKELINNLLNEEDLKKREIFRNLFSKTFLECIDQIIGKKRINELQGLEKCFENKIKSKVDREALKKLLNNFQEIITSKRPRRVRNLENRLEVSNNYE